MIATLYACQHCGRSASLPVTRCPACRARGRFLPAAPSVPPIPADAKRFLSPHKRSQAGSQRHPYGRFGLYGRDRWGDRFGLGLGLLPPVERERPALREAPPPEPPVDPTSPDVHLAFGLALPSSMATETVAFYGIRGSGKTYGMCRFGEELIRLRVPVVVLDPVGAIHGLATRTDGTPHPEVRLVGGDHSTEPLELGTGSLWAHIVDEMETGCLVFDLSDMRKDAQVVWVTEFLRDLYHLRGKRNPRTPLHVIVDEADTFAPQVGSSEFQNASRDACEDVVRKGRSRGLGSSWGTQRPALLHKNVASQTSVLVCGRLTSPHDREAIDTWVRAAGDEDKSLLVLDTLATLPTGHAWLYHPNWHQTLRKVRIRPRVTRDSSATPTVVGLGPSRGSVGRGDTPRAPAPGFGDADDGTLDLDLDDSDDDDGDFDPDGFADDDEDDDED